MENNLVIVIDCNRNEIIRQNRFTNVEDAYDWYTDMIEHFNIIGKAGVKYEVIRMRWGEIMAIEEIQK